MLLRLPHLCFFLQSSDFSPFFEHPLVVLESVVDLPHLGLSNDTLVLEGSDALDLSLLVDELVATGLTDLEFHVLLSLHHLAVQVVHFVVFHLALWVGRKVLDFGSSRFHMRNVLGNGIDSELPLVGEVVARLVLLRDGGDESVPLLSLLPGQVGVVESL